MRSRFRVVSIYLDKHDHLRWKVQQRTDSGESRWEDSVFHGINLFETSAAAVAKMNEIAVSRMLASRPNG